MPSGFGSRGGGDGSSLCGSWPRGCPSRVEPRTRTIGPPVAHARWRVTLRSGIPALDDERAGFTLASAPYLGVLLMTTVARRSRLFRAAATLLSWHWSSSHSGSRSASSVALRSEWMGCPHSRLRGRSPPLPRQPSRPSLRSSSSRFRPPSRSPAGRPTRPASSCSLSPSPGGRSISPVPGSRPPRDRSERHYWLLVPQPGGLGLRVPDRVQYRRAVHALTRVWRACERNPPRDT